MPFTFSHPAIVLPLTFLDKRKFSITALVIGSITPDFEYFANFKQQSIYSHTWLGVFWLDLPLAIVIFLVYNYTVKNTLIDNLPIFVKPRFAGFKNVKKPVYSSYKLLLIFTSLLIGITSHLFWDKLLHRGVALIEEPMDYYPLFWDGNSVIGAAIIAFLVWRLPKVPAEKTDGFLFWFICLLITLVVVIIRSFYSIKSRDMEVSALSGMLIGLLAASILYNLLAKKANSRSTIMEA